MKTRARALALMFTASLVGLTTTGAAADSAKRARTTDPKPGRPTARGAITLEGLTLSGTQFGTPSGQQTIVPTDPLSIPVTAGDTFTYSTITCASPFPPWNNVGLQFEPNYPGLTDPAPVRHEFQGSVVSATPSGDRAVVKGTITSYLCENGVRTDQIVSRFTAVIRPTTTTSVQLAGGGPIATTGGMEIRGHFHIVRGTGRFATLSGRGTLTGQFTCLRTTLQRNGAASCEQLGAYSEVPFQLQGHYRTRTSQVP